ncbi:hypothetical protein HPP92_021462 [Vanilla planifolia]|uniref:Uncharacterized protein n=1 Tax=Vanilla planifolia TaxID=51239 RepID=A0A835UKR7_VANPL|nr:hypothetical protein HPP92_021462 [Vanilla planifolia]
MSKLIAEMDLDTIEVDDDDEEEQQQILVPKKRKGKTDAVMAEEEAGSSSGRRERKKSKYLSPPYTNLREVGKFLSSLSKRLEGMSLRRVAGLSGSESTGFSAINKFSGEEDDDKIPLSQIESTPACEIFSEFISTAAYPLHLKRNPSAKVVRCFFAMYRSFIYSDSAKFEDYKNLVDEYITKNEDSEKDDLNPNSNKKNSKHGDHQASGLGLKRSKNGRETKPEFKQWNNCSEKQKPGGKRLSNDGISQAPVELDLAMVDDVKQSKEKQKLTRGKKPGDKASQEAPVELNLPSLEDLNDGKEIQKPSRAKKSGERTNHGAPLEVDLPLVEDINDGKEKQKRSRGKKSGGRTSQRAPIELDLPLVDNLNDGKERQKLNRGKKAPIEFDLSLVDDLIENKEKPKPCGGRKSGWRTSQRVPVEHDIPLVGDLNEGHEKQKPSNGSKSGKNYSLGALLALECCRVDPSCEVKGKKRYGSKSDSGKNLADASNESKRKRKPGWKKKILYSTTSFQAPADLDLRMEYDSNEGELGKGRKRWKHGTNAEAEDQKMASGSDAGDSEEKESISKSAYHSNNEVGLDVEPVSCRKPFIMNEKMMEGTEDAIGNNLQNFGVRISKLEGAKSGRKKKNSEGPLKAKPGRRKDKLSGTCFEGQAALQLTFHSGVSLPSIEDLVTTYSKYGTLIDNRIELFKESNSALVVFAKR